MRLYIDCYQECAMLAKNCFMWMKLSVQYGGNIKRTNSSILNL